MELLIDHVSKRFKDKRAVTDIIQMLYSIVTLTDRNIGELQRLFAVAARTQRVPPLGAFQGTGAGTALLELLKKPPSPGIRSPERADLR